MSTDTTNEGRAIRAKLALEAHNKLMGDEGADIKTQIQDLLTDLRHLAKREDVHYEAADNFAFQQFMDEEG